MNRKKNYHLTICILILSFAFPFESILASNKLNINLLGSAIESGGGKNEAEQQKLEQRDRIIKEVELAYDQIENIQKNFPLIISSIEHVVDAERYIINNKEQKRILENIYLKSNKIDVINQQLKLAYTGSTYVSRYNAKLKRCNIIRSQLIEQLAKIKKKNSEIESKSAKLDWLSKELLVKEEESRNFNEGNSIIDSPNTNIDFLSKSIEVKANSRDYSIEIRKGKYGVVDSNTNEILIPFKNWGIANYDDGIAEVNIILESETVCTVRLGSYSFSIYRNGYVDISGEFLDSPTIIAKGSFGGSVMLLLSRGNYDKEEQDRRDSLSKQRCINNGKERMSEVHSKYNEY